MFLIKIFSRLFESVVKYFDAFLSLIPLSFVLGFYVSYVASRWWQQFLAIPWPDKLFHTVACYIPGSVFVMSPFFYFCLKATMRSRGCFVVPWCVGWTWRWSSFSGPSRRRSSRGSPPSTTWWRPASWRWTRRSFSSQCLPTSSTPTGFLAPGSSSACRRRLSKGDCSTSTPWKALWGWGIVKSFPIALAEKRGKSPSWRSVVSVKPYHSFLNVLEERCWMEN